MRTSWMSVLAGRQRWHGLKKVGRFRRTCEPQQRSVWSSYYALAVIGLGQAVAERVGR